MFPKSSWNHFNIFFLISLKFIKNFLAIFPKFHQNTARTFELMPKISRIFSKIWQYFSEVILKFIAKYFIGTNLPSGPKNEVQAEY